MCSFLITNIKQIEKDLKIKQTPESNKKNELHLKQKSGQWRFSKNLNIFDSAHAVIVLTEWDDYKNIEWDLVAKNMVKPSWVFDSRSIVNAEEVKKSGINLWRLGDGS